jgi:nickel/cobalt transporter (NicO) family protein
MQRTNQKSISVSSLLLSSQKIGNILVWGLWLTALFIPQGAKAHPADMYFQTCIVDISSESITLRWNISPGPMLTPSTWYEADLDNNQVVSPEEAMIWVEPILKDIIIVMNETQPVDLVLDSVTWPNSLTAMEIGDQLIEISLLAVFPAEISPQTHISVSNNFMSGSSSYWFTVRSNTGIQFTQPDQKQNTLSFSLISPNGDGAMGENPDSFLTYWDSGVPEITPSGIINTVSYGEYQNTNADLINILRTTDIRPGLLIIGLLTSIFLGGLHALTPGHGKTIVAAYLVGSRGTIRHALFLGSIVTLTHTGSVMILGIITLLVSKYFLPTLFLPLLEILSGLLIVGLGAWLLLQRSRQWAFFRNQRKQISLDEQPSISDTSILERDTDLQTRIKLNIPIKEMGLPHQHPNIPDPSGVTWRSILTLGISGGLVPCPDAIAILLIAIAINRVLIGISLITTFSLGMAVVLIAIGVLMVQSQRLIVRFDASQRITQLIPIASALVVIVLGATITYNAIQRESFGQLVNAAPIGKNNLNDFFLNTIAANAPKNFSVQKAKITYLHPDNSEYNQLNVYSIDDGSTMPITDEPFGVWDYAISPDRESLVYSAPREDSTNDIKIITSQTLETKTLIACPDAACTAAYFSPDGTQVIYERLSRLSSDANKTGSTSLWWINVTTGETQPVFKNENLAGFNPRWSPDGQRFSYSAPGINAARLYDLETGASLSLPNRSGSIIDWSPDGKQVLVTDVGLHNDIFATHVIVYSIDDQAAFDLSTGESAQDTFAAWSPDGQWIAIVRRLAPNDQKQPGDNLWVMRPDGSDPRPLTSRVGSFHGRPIWAPDSIHLVYHVYSITQEGFLSGIWMMNTTTQTEDQLTDSGSRPAWIY